MDIVPPRGFDVPGRTGYSPVDPFGSLATFPNESEVHPHTAQKVKAHSFASPSFDGFALSRMKGVVDPGNDITARLAVATKTDDCVCFAEP